VQAFCDANDYHCISKKKKMLKNIVFEKKTYLLKKHQF